MMPSWRQPDYSCSTENMLVKEPLSAMFCCCLPKAGACCGWVILLAGMTHWRVQWGGGEIVWGGPTTCTRTTSGVWRPLGSTGRASCAPIWRWGTCTTHPTLADQHCCCRTWQQPADAVWQAGLSKPMPRQLSMPFSGCQCHGGLWGPSPRPPPRCNCCDRAVPQVQQYVPEGQNL